MKNLTLVIALIFGQTGTACSPEKLRKIENYYLGKENQTYIERRENEPTLYRGIATTRGQALEMAFKDIKEKRCPDKIGR